MNGDRSAAFLNSSLRVDPLFKRRKGLRNKEQRLVTAAQLIILILLSNYVLNASKQRLHKLKFLEIHKPRSKLSFFVS